MDAGIRLGLVVQVTCAALASAAFAHPPARILALPGPEGAAGSGSYAISADGRTVGGWTRDPSTLLQIAYAWRIDGDRVEGFPLGDLPGGIENSTVQSVSADGSVLTGPANSDLGQVGFRWTAETGMVDLGDLPGGAYGSYASDMTADGRVIAGYSFGEVGRQAVLWTPEGMRPLGFLPGGSNSMAAAITPDGRTVLGSSTSSEGPRLFRWTGETGMVSLPSVSAARLNPLTISDDGRVAGGWAALPGWEESWIWSEEDGLTFIGDLPGGEFKTWIWSLGTDGSTAVGYAMATAGKTAVIWDRRTGLRPLQQVLEQDYGLDLDGWYLRSAETLSPDGRVLTGTAETPSGHVEGFVVYLPPQCDDGLDNDGDGHVDYPDDPGCPAANSGPEKPECDDGRDNDGDGLVDALDPGCSGHWPYREDLDRPACGVGAELALLGPLGSRFRRARRRRRPIATPP